MHREIAAIEAAYSYDGLNTVGWHPVNDDQ